MFLHVPTVGIMLMFGAVTSAGSVVVAPAVAVFVMAGVCIAHTPYAAFKEYGIMKLPGKCHLYYKIRLSA